MHTIHAHPMLSEAAPEADPLTRSLLGQILGPKIPRKGEPGHGDLVERSTLTIVGNDDPALLIRVLGPIAAQTVPVESVSILRTEHDSFLHIVLVLRTQPGVAETIARRIGRLVDVARISIASED